MARKSGKGRKKQRPQPVAARPQLPALGGGAQAVPGPPKGQEAVSGRKPGDGLFWFDFMRYRKLCLGLSAALVLISTLSLTVRGLNLGLDFTEGVLVEVSYPDPPDLDEVRATLAGAGFSGAVVQNFGAATDIVVRLSLAGVTEPESVGDRIYEALRSAVEGTLQLRREEFVGPTVGEELREQGGLAILIALGLITLYIMFRFLLKFAIGAVVALIHDVLVVAGLFSIFQWEFDLPTLAALLAVIGYSLNDSIVISDRVRENFRLARRGELQDIINDALSRTLGRTLVTTATTLMVLLSLALFGGEQLRGFASALIIGVVVGTYSSIYVVAGGLVLLGVRREDFLSPEKEGAGADRGVEI